VTGGQNPVEQRKANWQKNDYHHKGAHLKPLEARYLKLELVNTMGMEEHLHAVMEVLRCHETGPLYEIGGRFVE
jgi:hypothetical protein